MSSVSQLQAQAQEADPTEAAKPWPERQSHEPVSVGASALRRFDAFEVHDTSQLTASATLLLLCEDDGFQANSGSKQQGKPNSST